MPLWAAETRILGIQNASKTTKKELPLPDPKQEAARMAALKKLRHRFVQLCSEHGDRSKPPVLAFERWLGRAALRRKPGDDPIIPSDLLDGDGMLVVDKGLIKDISRTLPSWESSTKVANEMTKEASKQIRSMAAQREERSLGFKDLPGLRKQIRGQGREVKEATKLASDAFKEFSKNEENAGDSDTAPLMAALASLQQTTKALNESATQAQKAAGGGNTAVGGGNIVFNGARREGIYDVMLCGPCGKPRRPYLTVSSLHLSKLLRLWKLCNTSTDNAVEDESDPIKTMNTLPEGDRILFQQSLYCCLARYEALKGAGYQCALPGLAFEAAASCGLGNTIECFASPLNCRYERFCSAFPDIESRFGSLGSFFDDDAFDPMEGSFEANPPFVPETMVAMGKKLERLLGDSKRGPLSFLVVVPAWGAGIEFIDNLEASIHLRASSRVRASDHAFCDGAQHIKPLLPTTKKKNNKRNVPDPDLRPSSWDTAVILLQNDAGASKWRVDGTKLEESFCKALKASVEKVPSKFSTLGAWENRGVNQGGGAKKRYRSSHEKGSK